jgi:vacuolar-type H+-ATPase subunit C/Vma6
MDTTTMVGFVGIIVGVLFLILSVLRTLSLRKISRLLEQNSGTLVPLKRNIKPKVKLQSRNIEEEVGRVPEPYAEEEYEEPLRNKADYKKDLRLQRMREELDREYNEKLKGLQ